jgi:hypothetical protein
MTEMIHEVRGGVVGDTLRRIGRELRLLSRSFSAALAAREAYNRYSIMSDAELARRGLTREEIPARVVAPLLSLR